MDAASAQENDSPLDDPDDLRGESSLFSYWGWRNRLRPVTSRLRTAWRRARKLARGDFPKPWQPEFTGPYRYQRILSGFEFEQQFRRADGPERFLVSLSLLCGPNDELDDPLDRADRLRANLGAYVLGFDLSRMLDSSVLKRLLERTELTTKFGFVGASAGVDACPHSLTLAAERDPRWVDLAGVELWSVSVPPRIWGESNPSHAALRSAVGRYQSRLTRALRKSARRPAGRPCAVILDSFDDASLGDGLTGDGSLGFAVVNATARATAAAFPRAASVRISQPTVSVVVPAYNHAAYIAESLESIRRQRLDGIALEVIVVDDGSRDETPQVVRDFLRRNPEFPCELIEQPNSGAHLAINRGVRMSRGQYVTILNSDDLFTPRRLQTLYETLRSTGQGLCYSDFDMIDNDSRSLSARTSPFTRFLRGGVRAIKRFPTLGYSLFAFNSTVSTGNQFFTRALFEKIGGYTDLKYCHDWQFVLAALEFTAPVRVERKMFRYRLHETNTSTRLGRELGERECRMILASAAKRLIESDDPQAFPLFPHEQEFNRSFLSRYNWLEDELQALTHRPQRSQLRAA